MNKSISTILDFPKKKSKFSFFKKFFFFCKCEPTESITSPQNSQKKGKQPNRPLKDCNYTQNSFLEIDLEKREKEELKIEKKSIKKEKSSLFQNNKTFFSTLEEIKEEDLIENYPEKELFFLRCQKKLMLARINSLSFKNVFHNKKFRLKSKSFTSQKHNDKLPENFKILQFFSILSDRILDHLQEKIKPDDIILSLDLKSGIQVIFNINLFTLINKVSYAWIYEYNNFK